LAIREGDWKLLCEYDGIKPELYNLARDPGETQNRAGENPEQVKRLTEMLLEWHRSMPPDNGPSLGEAALRAQKRQRQ